MGVREDGLGSSPFPHQGLSSSWIWLLILVPFLLLSSLLPPPPPPAWSSQSKALACTSIAALGGLLLALGGAYLRRCLARKSQM